MMLDMYQKHREMQFNRIEIIVPAIIAALMLAVGGLALVYQWNIMAFNAIIWVIVVLVLYKISDFILTIWVLDDNDHE